MNNFIEVYKNSLSKKSCDYIINCFSEHKDKTHTGKIGDGKTVDTKRKDSLDFNLLKIRNDSNEFLFDELKFSLNKNLKKYIKKYPLEDVKRQSYSDFSFYPFSVLAKKYKKKEQGYHIFHMDQGSHSPSVYRQLILMYYLNDVNEGGETEFYHQKIKIKPKQGRLVIFPAAFTHMHRGNPVISNKKYILNSWIVYN